MADNRTDWALHQLIAAGERTAQLQRQPQKGAHEREHVLVRYLNGPKHRKALLIFMALILGHWAEHVAQGIEVFILRWPRPDARGLLGLLFPWLVTSEWLHYWFAALTLVGLLVLRPAFAGRDRHWWNWALGIQVWHHFEHVLLVGQVLLGQNIFGKSVPTSVIQLVIPRVELHLIYNALVTIPMVAAMYYHGRPPIPLDAVSQRTCTCGQHGTQQK